MRARPFGWFRLAWQKILLAVTDTTVDPATSSFSFDDYDITANSSSTATASVVARNASDEALVGKSVVLAIETIAVSAANSLVTCSPAEIADDGADSVTITVQVKDASGRPIPDIPAADVVLASTGSGNTITQPTGSTNQAGVITGSMVSTVAATKTLSATVRSTAITDTASVVVTGTPAASGRANEPVGFSPIAEWNNEAALVAEGFTIDGATTWGEKTRVTTGYGSAPSIGGAAVMQTFYAGGVDGGYDPQRLEYQGLAGGGTELYISVEAKWASDYPVSNSPGGGKQFILWFVGGARYVMNFDLSLAGGYWTIFPNSDIAVDLPTTGYHVLGSFTETEWYFDRGTGAADGIIRAYQAGTMILEETGVTFPGGAADFDYFVVDHANNGNRYATGVSPEVRTISTVYPGEIRDAYVWTSAVYLSRP